MEREIDTIIFDVGGVLLPNFTYRIRNDISNSLNLKRKEVDHAFNSLIPLLGKGWITEEEFWERFRELTKYSKDSDTSNLLTREMKKRHAPFSFVNDITRSLKIAGYKLGIVSNTIQAHASCHAQHGIYDNFSIRVLSYEVGVRKPDPRIFEIALEKLHSSPNNTIYIDDTPAFVEAAERLGMKGIVFQNDNQLKSDLEKIGVKFDIIPEEKQTNTGAFAIIITNDNKIVLQQRTVSDKILTSGKISVFGGRLSRGEKILDGLRRELLEELELLVDDYWLEELGVYQKTKELDSADDTLHIFVIRNVNVSRLKLHEGKAMVIESPEIFVNNPNLTRITRLAVEDLIKKTYPSCSA